MPYQMMVLVVENKVSVCSGNRKYLQADSKTDLFNLLIHNKGQINGDHANYSHGEPNSIFFNQFLPCIRKGIGKPSIEEQGLEVHVFEGDDSGKVKQCAIKFAQNWNRKDIRPETQGRHLYLHSKGFAVVHNV